MKFDELCESILLGEADYDSLTGKDKVYSLKDGAETDILDLKLDDIRGLIKQTVLPISVDYIKRLVVEDLVEYLPAGVNDIKKLLKRSIWNKFEESEKKSTRAADILFSFLKKKGYIIKGIVKSDNEDDIDNLSKDIENDIEEPEYSDGLSMSDVEKYGGVVPRSTGHPEDESNYY